MAGPLKRVGVDIRKPGIDMRRPIPWLVILLIILAVGEGLGALLAAQDAAAAGAALRVIGRLATAGWLLWALHVWKDVPWVSRVRAAVAGLVAAGLFAGLSWALGWADGVWIAAGVVGMAATFFVGLFVARWLLSPGTAVTGVARTLLDEAIRMRLPVVFIIGLMLIVPVLPFVLDPGDRLEYRVQSFLSWSAIAVSLLLSLMTIFLAIGSVTRELERRQVFLSLTKPVRRWQYLLGKWLGVVVLNAVLVPTAGVGVYAFTLYLANQPAIDRADRDAVTQRVLVARGVAAPQPSDPGYFDRAVQERIELLRSNDAQWMSGATEMAEGDERNIRTAVINEWLAVGPRSSKTYVFNGLGEAKERAREVQLRLEPEAAGSLEGGMVRLAMRVNGRPYTPYGAPLLELSEGTPHTLWVPTEVIDDEGRIELTITNPAPNEQAQPTVSFSPDEGLQMLYRVGGFEANLTRSLAMLWVRLGFLAALAVAASTFLGFPVAALLCTMVYLVASGGGFVTDSLDNYSASPRDVETTWELLLWYPTVVVDKFAEGEPADAIKIVIRGVGEAFSFFVPSFADYSGGDLVADGRLVSYRQLGGALLKVGLLWGGACGLIGYAIFVRKEIAKVTV